LIDVCFVCIEETIIELFCILFYFNSNIFKYFRYAKRDLAIDNYIVNCIFTFFSKQYFSLKMAPTEGPETCSWE